MGWRVRKRFKIVKGMYINVGKRGTSLSVGTRGATVNFSKRGTRTTVGLPGTGISYSTFAKSGAAPPRSATTAADITPSTMTYFVRTAFVTAFVLFLAVTTKASLAIVAAPFCLMASIVLAAFAFRERKQERDRQAAQLAPGDVLMKDVYARLEAEKPAQPVRSVRTDSLDGDLAGAKREFPRAAARAVQLPETDNWETGQIAGRPDEVPVHAALYIHYCDAQGQLSSRNITLRSIVPWEGNDIAMLAYCHEREAHRTFLASRVLQAVELDTGEIIKDVDRWLRLNFTNTPKGRIAAALKAVESECLILSYIARADGAMRAKERQIIARFIAGADREIGIDAADEVELDKRVRTIYCDYDEYRAAIDKVRDQAVEQRHAVVEAARAIINSEKRIDPAEQKAVDVLAEMLA